MTLLQLLVSSSRSPTAARLDVGLATAADLVALQQLQWHLTSQQQQGLQTSRLLQHLPRSAAWTS
jgi:hypothetical protein